MSDSHSSFRLSPIVELSLNLHDQDPVANDLTSSRTPINPLLGIAFSFLVGATVPVEVHLVGVLRVSELILAGYVFLAAINGSLPRTISALRLAPLLMLGFAWISSQFVSDGINNTTLTNTLKGHANIGMIFSSLLGFVVLFFPDFRRFNFYLVGQMFGCVGDFFVHGIEDTSEYWDVVIAPLATPAILLFGIYHARRHGPTGISLATIYTYGLASIAFGARSHGLIMVMLATSWWYGTHSSLGPAIERVSANPRRLLQAGVVSVAAILILFIAYVQLAKAGHLTAKARRQIQMLDNPYNPLEVLRSGRGALDIAIMAISEKPIMGHGSKAHIPKYTLMNPERRSGDVRPEIPTHSVLFAAWVFSGIAGAIFWVAVLILHWKLLGIAIASGKSLAIFLVSYLFWQGAWHILFSPYGYARFDWPPMMAIAILTTASSFVVKPSSLRQGVVNSGRLHRA